MATPAYVLPWVLWAVTGRKKGERPSDAPAAIPAAYLWIPGWVVWKRAGAEPTRRPKDAPRKIPPVGWDALAYVKGNAPKPTPPPPPKPPTLDRFPRGITFYAAWGFQKGGIDLARVRALANVGPVAVALEVGPQAGDVDEKTGGFVSWGNEARVGWLRGQLEGRVPVGSWGIIPDPIEAADLARTMGVEFYRAQSEGFTELYPGFVAAFADRYPVAHLSTVTNVGGLRDPATWRRALVDVEAYMNENPASSPVNLHADLQNLSGGPLPSVRPLVGIYTGANGTWRFRSYFPYLEGYDDVGIYLLEHMTADDFDAAEEYLRSRRWT